MSKHTRYARVVTPKPRKAMDVATFQDFWDAWMNFAGKFYLSPMFTPIEPPNGTIEKRWDVYIHAKAHPTWPSDVKLVQRLKRLRDAARSGKTEDIAAWLAMHFLPQQLVGIKSTLTISYWLARRAEESPKCDECSKTMIVPFFEHENKVFPYFCCPDAPVMFHQNSVPRLFRDINSWEHVDHAPVLRYSDVICEGGALQVPRELLHAIGPIHEEVQKVEARRV